MSTSRLQIEPMWNISFLSETPLKSWRYKKLLNLQQWIGLEESYQDILTHLVQKEIRWMSLSWWNRVKEASSVNIYEKFYSIRGLQTKKWQDKWIERMQISSKSVALLAFFRGRNENAWLLIQKICWPTRMTIKVNIK